MEFKKYPSIENSYREKYINGWLSRMPELASEEFIITEKIHGANFQIFITPDDFKFGKRTSFIEEGEKFFGYHLVMEDYAVMIGTIQAYLYASEHKSMRIFGELFGSNIQKGVDYGEEKRFRAFDVYVDDILLSQYDGIFLLSMLGYEDVYVPILDVVEGLDKALEFDTEIDSALSDKEDNMIEGVIIKPYKEVYSYDDFAQFSLKFKNQAFLEKASKARVPRAVLSDRFKEVQKIYVDHLTDNRLQGVFSKHGEIEQPKQMGDYIKFMLEDAKEDFLEDYMEEFLSVPTDERSKIFSASGSIVAPMLKKYL